MRIKSILKQTPETLVDIKGRVRFNRVSKNIGFLTIFDGSNLEGIQVVYKVESDLYEQLSKLANWSGIHLKGILVKGKQLEVEAKEIIRIWAATDEHPLGKKEHGLEYLRNIAHMRPNAKLFQSIMKIRSIAAQATHNFFSANDFIYVHSPIITGNDAEGAGESFYVGLKNGDTFFSNQGSLTVSGQLHAEGYAQTFGKVYTFGPTFRAENSNTSRHASEFWMIEPEVAFADYNDMMNIGEEHIKFVVKTVLDQAEEELKFLEKYYEKEIISNLDVIVKNKFIRISYSEVIEKLKEADVKFEESNIEFGIDFATEHERYLAEQLYKKPVYVYDYPTEIKSFYMYKNDDNKTVRGFDLLVPEIGELIGGSQRLETAEELIESAKSKGSSVKDLEWYIQLRKEGYVTSSGYGLGFERLVMLLTGVENIRDSIPFPRTPGKLEF